MTYVEEGIQKAMDLAQTTSTTLKVTSNMLRNAEVLFQMGLEAKDETSKIALNMQLKTFREAIKALDSLAELYDNLSDGIADGLEPVEASSWS